MTTPSLTPESPCASERGHCVERFVRPLAPPRGFLLVKQTEPIRTGDLVSDSERRWRGPVVSGNALVGTCAKDMPHGTFVCRPNDEVTP